MRLLLHCPFVLAENTGITRYLRGLLQALATHAPDLEIHCLIPPGWKGLPAPLIPVPLTIHSGGGAGHPLGRLLRESAFLRRLHRESPFDLFHSPFGYLPFSVPTPSALTVPDLRALRLPRSFSPLRGAFLRTLLPRSIRRAAAILPMSEFTRQELLTLVPGSTEKKIFVAYPGVDAFWQAPATPDERAAFRARLSGAFFLAVGTREPHKNLGVLLAALEQLPEKKLALVGRTFASGRQQALTPPPNAVFLGRLTDTELRAAYAEAQAYCFPSLYEGFGYPPLEALAQGCPVVAADIPVLREVLGSDATFASPHDPAALAAALTSARYTHAPSYTWEAHVAVLRRAYHAILSP
ncbi:glycosyltransferase family 4 protein [Armatimonas rosea]|uniref:Glycosyltransferase involved in cell wall biosynthesis n=1 Tax=Armatimonas rosea TaxID=685828 RepID=A0A7W9W4T2_ARMRO|nr:glycosyltransferase family 1 protein [Armatimonas rosea]MBB6048858.1 glycosyltransferase involved in cell wall biosynthesis [Armatimonas rosea]